MDSKKKYANTCITDTCTNINTGRNIYLSNSTVSYPSRWHS